jgi:hypothetical protein
MVCHWLCDKIVSCSRLIKLASVLIAGAISSVLSGCCIEWLEIIQVVDDCDDMLCTGLGAETKEGSSLGLESTATFLFDGSKLGESLGWVHLKSSETVGSARIGGIDKSHRRLLGFVLESLVQ